MYSSRRSFSFLLILALQGECLLASTTVGPVPVNNVVPPAMVPATMVLNPHGQQAFLNPFAGGMGWYVALVPAPAEEQTSPSPIDLATTSDTTPASDTPPTTYFTTTAAPPPPINTTAAPPTPAPARPPPRPFPPTNPFQQFWQNPLFLASMEGGDSMKNFMMARMMQQQQMQQQMQFQQQMLQQQQMFQQQQQKQQQQKQQQQQQAQSQQQQMPQPYPGFNMMNQLAPLGAMSMMGDSFRNMMAASALSRSMGMGGGLLGNPLAYKALGDLPEYYLSPAASLVGLSQL